MCNTITEYADSFINRRSHATQAMHQSILLTVHIPVVNGYVDLRGVYGVPSSSSCSAPAIRSLYVVGVRIPRVRIMHTREATVTSMPDIFCPLLSDTFTGFIDSAGCDGFCLPRLKLPHVFESNRPPSTYNCSSRCNSC